MHERSDRLLNQTVIVGRLVHEPEIRKTETGRKVTNITLAVPRTYKNMNGEYETDFIDCLLWSGVAENTKNYCHQGDILGVKGRIQTRVIEVAPDKRHHVSQVVAEKVTFLSPRKQDPDEEISTQTIQDDELVEPKEKGQH